MRNATLVACLSLLAAGGPAHGGDDDPSFWVGKRLPLIHGRKDHWVNVTKPPSRTTWKGRVLLITFKFLKCPSCKAFEPTLERWYDTWYPKGLRIIAIDNGEIDTRVDVRDHARAMRTKYPVLWDEKAKQTKKFRVSSYPTALLVGPDEKVIWQGSPTRWRRSLEKAIESHLKSLPKRGRADETSEEGKEPEWLSEVEAFKRAKVDRKRVLLFKHSPSRPDSLKIHAMLCEPPMLEYLGKNFHCIASDHPKFSKKKREPLIWKLSDIWDKKAVLWVFGPDRKRKAAVDHEKEGKLIDAKELRKRLEKAAAAKPP